MGENVVEPYGEHPRARGENHLGPAASDEVAGTSPRTRGKRAWWLLVLLGRRNIPAHAGKTPLHTPRAVIVPEHPRARGENPPLGGSGRKIRGTSPRTRGKHHQNMAPGYRCRNIPAHAGKTRHLLDRPPGLQEHPRARGENHGLPVGK